MKDIFIITGASRGIGKEIVEYLLKKEKKVLAISRNISKTTFSSEKNLLKLALDLSEKNAAQKLQNFSLENNLSISGLVNNAGLLISEKIPEITFDTLESQFQVNVFQPLMIVKYLLPLFSKNAHVVNITSMGGVQGSQKFSGLAAYSSSKGALAVLTESMAEELDEIRVNALSLGAVDTEMLRQAFPDYIAKVSSETMGQYIAEFLLNGHEVYNGKCLPVALTNP
jgi:short-subunit dehydrogenase